MRSFARGSRRRRRRREEAVEPIASSSAGGDVPCVEYVIVGGYAAPPSRRRGCCGSQGLEVDPSVEAGFGDRASDGSTGPIANRGAVKSRCRVYDAGGRRNVNVSSPIPAETPPAETMPRFAMVMRAWSMTAQAIFGRR